MGPSEEKRKALALLLARLGVKKQDLEERFIKSSGRGGQKVNKSASAVFIRHTKTGLNVKYGKHRSQDLNRFMALRLLAEKIQAQENGQNTRQEQLINKRRKQKQKKRSRTRKKYADPKTAKAQDE